MPEDDEKIRNAFVVDPDGNVEERKLPQRISPLVNNLENIRNILKKSQEKGK